LHDRAVRVARQRGQAAHAADDIDERRFHVRADRERQEDLAAAGIGVAVDFLNAREALQHLLLGLEQLGLDFLGRGAAPVREDRDLRTLDVGEELQRQVLQTERAEQAHEQHSHADRDRIAYGSSDDAHGRLPDWLNVA
jgi:hypothetical protein